MNRRDTFRLIPLSIAGLTCMRDKAFSEEMPGKLPPGAHPAPFKKPLSVRYLDRVREMLIWIKRTQSENLLEASYAIADAVAKKRTCWYSWDMGHSTTSDIVSGRPGSPEIFTPGFNAGKAKKGDLFLANIWGGNRQDLIDKEIFVIGGPAPWGGDARKSELLVRDSAKLRMRPYSHIWIETNVDTIGAIMKVPGMSAHIGPVSGIIGMVTYWMMIADTCRILARDGKSVRVQGDERQLSGNNIPWVNLHNPLMDDYFEQYMKQMEMIDSEMGNIREIAKMAADSVVSGGKVYVYSKDRSSLCVEAQTRRGGLALTQGATQKDGKAVMYNDTPIRGNSKDLVIMGIFAPDDPVDLACLDQFRSGGMKVASIGPMTRDIKVPEGRTVPKEADVHVGRMCDTYGLYAVPGFKQKVCPTSGAVQNQIFWATCMEIVEEIIRRTGNVPGVFWSAAIRHGTEHMYRVQELYRERGY
ncbi:hypothetical protein ACFL5B_02110 [Candidatus Latescibacterota bacterium]